MESVADPSGFTPRDFICETARRRLDAFAAIIAPDGTLVSRIYESVKALSEEIGQDYGGRFLLELVQNGYDAHPPGATDGEIAIHVVPDESEHGTLYVANMGRGFTRSNVEALCDVAISDKPPGEQIGNKGLGFRSVLSICTKPEIYSRAAAFRGSVFDGFCFRFAEHTDLEDLIADGQHRQLAQKYLPQFYIPVPINQPVAERTLGRLADAGFATVVKLPLRSPAAYGAVLDAIEELRSTHAPLLAFLPRVSKLMIFVNGESSPTLSLVRSSTPLRGIGLLASDRYEVVEMGETGRYLVCWRSIEEKRVVAAISESVSQGSLHSSWLRWRGGGEVALALPLHEGVVKPQMYTFLPMGSQADAPFHGLLHGAFYPKANRTSMDASVPLNALYLRESLALSASTIIELRSKGRGLPELEGQLGRLVVDLMSWKSTPGIAETRGWDFPRMIADALGEAGSPVQSSDLFPIDGPNVNTGWALASSASRWDSYSGLTVLSPSKLVTIGGVSALLSSLGKDRTDRLETFLRSVGIRDDLRPSEDEQAMAVEKVAAHLLSQGKKAHTSGEWRQFYKELGGRLVGTNWESWTQRRILLCGDGNLRSSSGKRVQPKRGKKTRASKRSVQLAAVVFFPPVRRRKGVLEIPKALRQYFAFLDDRLDWAGELQETSQVFERVHAVHRYDADEIVASVSTVVTQESSQSVREAGLEWSFTLWSQTKGTEVLRRAHLLLPNVEGEWIDCDVATFSRGWPESTLGKTIHDLVDRAGPGATELRELRKRLLGSPRARPFGGKQIHLWAEFLVVLGVRKGLSLQLLEPRTPTMSGYSVSLPSICQQLRIGPKSQRYIAESTPTQPPLEYRGTQFTLPTSVHYIPGQEDFEILDDGSKELFAQLVVELASRLDRNGIPPMRARSESRPQAGRVDWLSPAEAFLKAAPWFPVVEPGDPQGRVFVKPELVLLEPDTGERLPVCLARPASAVRRLLTGDVPRNAFRRICGGGIYDQQECLMRQVQLLAIAAYRGWWPAGQERACENAYWDTWRRMVAVLPGTQWRWLDERRVLVFRFQGSPKAFSLAEGSVDRCYVRDTRDDLTSRLLEQVGRILWDAGPKVPEQIVSLLSQTLGIETRGVSKVTIQALIDGSDYAEASSSRAVEYCPCLPRVVAYCMAALRGTAAQQLRRDWGPTVQLAERLIIYRGTKVEISLEGADMALPDDYQGCLNFGDSLTPTVLVESSSSSLDWRTLKNARRAIAQAIGYVEIAPHLFTGFTAIQQQNLDPDADLADIDWRIVEEELQLNSIDIERANAAATGDRDRILQLLAALVVYYAGSSSLAELTAEGGTTSTNDLLSHATTIIGQDVVDIQRLLSPVKMSTFEDLLEGFELDLERLNRALEEIGQAQLSFAEEQTSAVQAFLSVEDDRIMRPIRLAYLPVFRSYGDMAGYTKSRDTIRNLQPDPAWLFKVREPTPRMIDEHLQRTILNLKLPSVTAELDIPPYSEIRRENLQIARSIATTCLPLVKAWCRKNGVPPGIWDNDDCLEKAVNALEIGGALDFLRLSETDVVTWFKALSCWPIPMPASVDANALGLTDDDLSQQRRILSEERAKQARERRLVTVGDAEVDSGSPDVTALVDQFASALKARKDVPSLDITGGLQRPASHRRGGGHTGRGGSRVRMLPEQRELVGFLGELAVYYWLQRILPKQDIDRAWVSCNREKTLGGGGNDGLGYDFMVFKERKKVFLEVKGHLGDPMDIDLGETEVVFAQECARKRRDFRVVYASGLESPDSMRIEVLPNPFSPEGQRLYRLDNEGLKYRFRRERSVSAADSAIGGLAPVGF